MTEKNSSDMRTKHTHHYCLIWEICMTEQSLISWTVYRRLLKVWNMQLQVLRSNIAWSSIHQYKKHFSSIPGTEKNYVHYIRSQLNPVKCLDVIWDIYTLDSLIEILRERNREKISSTGYCNMEHCLQTGENEEMTTKLKVLPGSCSNWWSV